MEASAGQSNCPRGFTAVSRKRDTAKGGAVVVRKEAEGNWVAVGKPQAVLQRLGLETPPDPGERVARTVVWPGE